MMVFFECWNSWNHLTFIMSEPNCCEATPTYSFSYMYFCTYLDMWGNAFQRRQHPSEPNLWDARVLQGDMAEIVAQGGWPDVPTILPQHWRNNDHSNDQQQGHDPTTPQCRIESQNQHKSKDPSLPQLRQQLKSAVLWTPSQQLHSLTIVAAKSHPCGSRQASLTANATKSNSIYLGQRNNTQNWAHSIRSFAVTLCCTWNHLFALKACHSYCGGRVFCAAKLISVGTPCTWNTDHPGCASSSHSFTQ